MLKATQTRKRKVGLIENHPTRTVEGSAYTQCPLCDKQVPLSLINVHIESKECQRACTQRQARQYAISVEAPSVQLPRPVRLPLAAGKPVPQKFQPSDGRPESDCLQQAASDAQLGTSSGGCGRHEYVPSLASKTCHDKDGAESSCVQSCHRKESSQPEIENSLPPPIAQLVPEPHAALPGEYRITDFVTKQEELDLIHMLDAAPPLWQDSTFNGKHRGKRWGVTMDLSKRTVVEGPTPLASELHMLIARMQSIPLLSNFCPNEANAIDYRKPLGHWLKPHVDDRKLSTDKIVTLSLAGSANMTFNCVKGSHSVAVELPPRTLQVITRDARYKYSHGIGKEALTSPRRLSITFRQSPLKD